MSIIEKAVNALGKGKAAEPDKSSEARSHEARQEQNAVDTVERSEHHRPEVRPRAENH